MKRILLTIITVALLLPNALFATMRNPMIWADTPDPDVIRVGDYYYMVTTTMHLMPGAPIMRSKDFTNWETVGYLFDKLTDSPKYNMEDGTAYGRGQWATSLKYHKGTFYALFAPNDSRGGDTYIMTAKDAAGPWKIHSRLRHFHDASLFFDDDDRVYVIYGTGEMCELTKDLQGVVPGSDCKIFKREADETGLLEGSRMIKHNGKYYLLMISHVYAPGRHRRQVCYRADDIRGPYEKKVILQSDFGGFPHVGQGTIVDGTDGKWYGVIFQDRGAVGRVLTVMPCQWIDGWPILGDENGKVPETMPLGEGADAGTRLVFADDFETTELGSHWQWNHNPVDEAWSLTERKGHLRLKTNKIVKNLYEARNTVSQRMEGPRCLFGHSRHLHLVLLAHVRSLRIHPPYRGSFLPRRAQGSHRLLCQGHQGFHRSQRAFGKSSRCFHRLVHVQPGGISRAGVHRRQRAVRLHDDRAGQGI